MNLINYFKETKAEMKEVTFPTVSQTIMFTMTVIILSLIVAALLGAVDFGLKEGLIRLLNK